MQQYNVDTGEHVEQVWDTRSFAIEGMTCDNCVKHITRALKRVNGVKNVEVDLDGGNVTVTFDTTKTDIPAIHDAVLASGYRPTAEVPG